MAEDVLATCTITQHQLAWRPGDDFSIAWEVANPVKAQGNTSIVITDATVEVVGKEIVDTKWISNAYHSAEPVVSSSARRLVRHIFTSNGVLVAAPTLRPGEKVIIAAHCALPPALPPTFHGTSARFSYAVEVTCNATPLRRTRESSSNGGLSQARGTTSDSAQSSSSSLAPWAPGAERASGAFAVAAEKAGPESEAGAAAPQQPRSVSARQAFRVIAALPPDSAPCSHDDGGEMQPLLRTATSIGRDFTRDSHVPSPSPTAGPFLAYAMMLPHESPPVDIDVGAVVPMAAPVDGVQRGRSTAVSHRFLWAPNEMDEVAGGPPTASTRGGSQPPSRSPSPSLRASPKPLESPSIERSRSFLPSGSASGRNSPSATSRWARSESGTPRTLARDALRDLESRSFQLKLKEQPLARVEMHIPDDRPLLPGSTFSGTIDLRHPPNTSPAPARCHQVVVLLETEEAVSKEWLLRGHRKAGKDCIRQLFQEVQEVTRDVAFTSFMFTIPYDAPVCFQTAVLALRWRLRFEFIVARSEERWAKPEELVWKLPLAVAALPIPFHS